MQVQTQASWMSFIMNLPHTLSSHSKPVLWKVKPSSSIICSRSSSKVRPLKVSSWSEERPSSELSGLINCQCCWWHLLPLGEGVGLLRSMTALCEQRDWKTRRSLFTCAAILVHIHWIIACFPSQAGMRSWYLGRELGDKNGTWWEERNKECKHDRLRPHFLIVDKRLSHVHFDEGVAMFLNLVLLCGLGFVTNFLEACGSRTGAPESFLHFFRAPSQHTFS